jgi:hypothetical protein
VWVEFQKYQSEGCKDILLVLLADGVIDRALLLDDVKLFDDWTAVEVESFELLVRDDVGPLLLLDEVTF